MQEYKNRFINYINNIKYGFINDELFFIEENFDGMSIDGECEEGYEENMLKQFNPLDDGEGFLDENVMILED